VLTPARRSSGPGPALGPLDRRRDDPRWLSPLAALLEAVAVGFDGVQDGFVHVPVGQVLAESGHLLAGLVGLALGGQQLGPEPDGVVVPEVQ
jgi:hypothetical protein